MMSSQAERRHSENTVGSDEESQNQPRNTADQTAPSYAREGRNDNDNYNDFVLVTLCSRCPRTMYSLAAARQFNRQLDFFNTQLTERRFVYFFLCC